MTTAFSSKPTVKIEGKDLPDKLDEALGPCWVESSVNLPGAFHLTFRESAKLLVGQFPLLLRIGARVAVYGVADGQGREKPLITGLVTGIEAEYQDGLGATVLRGLDHSFKMLRHRRATGHRYMTAAEIVTELAELDGVELGVIEQTSPRYELITQPNVSDWQFVKYLADSSDMEADFDDEGLLRFRKARPAVSGMVAGTSWNPRVLEFDDDMLQCRTGVTASDQVTEVTSRGWNVDEKRTLLGKAPAVANPGISIGTTPGEAVSKFGSVTLTETGTPYGTEAETDRAAASLAADIASAFAELEVQVNGRPDLVPGLVIELKEAGPPFDGTYTITTTRHEFDNKNYYTTWVWVTGRQVRTLYGLASGGDQPAPRVPGVVNAIVDDINDPAQQGRVKLRFPWFSDSYKTDWVRTVQFGGYKGGGVISPEVEDEVLVAFDRGSLDHPYVLGGLYSNAENNKPSPHDVDLHTGGRLNRRSLVSRTGQRLELLDAVEKGKTGVRLRSGDKKLTVFLEETQTKITISSDGAIDISGRTTVNVTAKEVSVTAEEVSVTAKEKISLDTSYVNISGEFINIKGITTINGILTQNGAAEINGDFNVAGDAMVSGFTALNGAAAVTGDLTLDGDQVMVVPA
jgi:phage protein D/phage baseplate assembly protein gpV